MTHWWWVRHGPTHAKTFVGHRDVAADLSDTDLIRRVHDYLPQDAVVISSDLIRASATAQAIGGSRVNLGQFQQIREFDFGVWDGMAFDDVAKRDPVLSRQYWEQPGDICAPEGESWNDAATRISAFVDQMNATHPNTHIIAVAHFGAILTQVQRASGKSAYDTLAQTIDNFSVSDMRFDEGNWTIGAINHLP